MKKLAFVVIATIFSVTLYSKTIYVKSSATGNNNGTSWLHAYTKLQTALDSSVVGDTIKVAEGIYKPGLYETDRFAMKNGVIVYGGYANDTTFTNRNWSLYKTILSGEIGNPGSVYNSFIILESHSIDSTTIWDGFIIEKARYGGSQLMEGGIMFYNANPVIRNFLFRENGKTVKLISSNPVFQNCIFYQNGLSGSSTVNSNLANPTFINCLFANNNNAESINQTGGIITIINCSFFNNRRLDYEIKASNNGHLVIANSIFYNKNPRGSLCNYRYDSSELNLVNATVFFENSILQNYGPGPGILHGYDPKFMDTSDIDGPDNVFFTGDDGLQLNNPCSPGLNAGNNGYVNYNIDLTGRPRIFNNGIVDLGPYENQSSPGQIPRVIYVSKSATGANTGVSWTNAYTDLQKALQSCADTIKVAEGIYLPSTFDASASFWLNSKTIILGGYPSIGNPSDADRNPENYATILSGKISSTIRSDYVVRAHAVDSTTLLDGFIVKSNQTFGCQTSAGILFSNNANPIIKNCKILNNFNGIYCYNNSNPFLVDCIIDTSDIGGLIVNSSPRFLRTEFKDNYTGIKNIYSSGEYDSCLFANNINGYLSTVRYGGGMSNISSAPFIKNSIFKNNGSSKGGDIYNASSNPLIIQTTFVEPILSERGGSIFNEYSNPLFQYCEFKDIYSLYDGSAVYNIRSNPEFIGTVFNSKSNISSLFYNKDSSSPVLANCIAYNYDGFFMENIRSFPSIINSTIANRITGTKSVIRNWDSSKLTIKNSILWGNVQYPYTPDNIEISNAGGSLTMINHSVTQRYGVNGMDGNFVGINPRLYEFYDADGLDNKFFTSDDGFRLTACSPLINAGMNSATSSSVDILHNPRIYGSNIDPGAYEFQSVPGNISRTVYVNQLATGTNDGSSWQNAYTSLWSGLNNICADTIRVAQGVYKPAVNSRDSSFLLLHNKYLLGGYPSSGNPDDSTRDARLYPTVLSGEIGLLTDSSDNIKSVLKIFKIDSSFTLDGFSIEKGFGANKGAGLYIFNSEGNVMNCTIEKNYALSGGGLAIDNSSRIKLSSCIIANNKSASSGGGAEVRSNPFILISNSVFHDNTSQEGGGIFLSQSGITCFLNNVIFYNNTALRGGALYNSGGSNPFVTNCTFFRNRATQTYHSSGIYTTYYFPVANSIFMYNSYADSMETIQGYDIYNPSCPPNCYSQNINYNRLQSTSIGNNTNWGGNPLFVNFNDPDGTDNIWMTEDDGLRLQPCSRFIDFGSTEAVQNIPTDILGNNRIIGIKPDAGAYEYIGSPIGTSFFVTAGDSLFANKEYTTEDGWTHYYNGCIYLLSIKKQGQNIGSVGDGTFQLKIALNSPYGSGQATNLTSAQYNTSGNPWFAMNRSWSITPTNQVQDSILIRFPYSTIDFIDLQGSNPGLVNHDQLIIYNVLTNQNPIDTNIIASDFSSYLHSATPSLSTWVSGVQDSIHYGEYYVSKLGGGSAGIHYNGSLADVIISYAGLNSNNLAPNHSFVAKFTESNIGQASAGNHNVHFYFSQDNILTPNSNGDIFLDYETIIGPLTPSNTTDTLTKQLFIPCSVTPGNYFLFIVADGENVLAETNELNNKLSFQITVVQGSSTPPAPLITASPSASVCQPNGVILRATISDCYQCDYSWNTGETTDTLLVHFSGTYTFTVTNPCGSSSASQIVTINNPPNITVNTGSILCVNTSNTFTANGATNYQWSGPGLQSDTGSTVTVIPPQAGNIYYTVSGLGANGCSTTGTFVVTVNPNPTVDIIQSNMDICVGTSVNLQATGQGIERYFWSPSTGLNTTEGPNVIATPSNTTTYVVTGRNVLGCEDRDSVTISTNCTTTGIPNIDGLEALTISPNPANGIAILNIKLNRLKSVGVDIQDGLGKTIYRIQPHKLIGNVRKPLNLMNVPAGLYYVKVTIDDKLVTLKLVIQK